MPGMRTQAAPSSSSSSSSRSEPSSASSASAPEAAGRPKRASQKPTRQPSGESMLQPTGTRTKDKGPEDRPSEDWGWGLVRTIQTECRKHNIAMPACVADFSGQASLEYISDCRHATTSLVSQNPMLQERPFLAAFSIQRLQRLQETVSPEGCPNEDFQHHWKMLQDV